MRAGEPPQLRRREPLEDCVGVPRKGAGAATADQVIAGILWNYGGVDARTIDKHAIE